MSTITVALKGHFLRLYQIAFSDDNFHPLELKMLYRFAEDRGITRDELNDILLSPSNSVVIPDDLEEKIAYLYDLAIMIWADEQITEDERIALKKYCLKFGFMEEHIDELSQFLLDKAKEGMPFRELIKIINE